MTAPEFKLYATLTLPTGIIPQDVAPIPGRDALVISQDQDADEITLNLFTRVGGVLKMTEQMFLHSKAHGFPLDAYPDGSIRTKWEDGTTDVYVLLPWIAGKRWEWDEAKAHVVKVPGQPSPASRYTWLQGRKTYNGTTYRLYGAPYVGGGKYRSDVKGGEPTSIELVRGGKIIDKWPLPQLGCDANGKPYDGLLEAEGLGILTKPDGTVHVLAGVATGGRKNRRYWLHTCQIDGPDPTVATTTVKEPTPVPAPKPTPAPTHALMSVNCQWPGFSKSPAWGSRGQGFADAIQASGASIVLAQELGLSRVSDFSYAEDLATKLGNRWAYHRANGGGVGLNCVFWRDDWQQDGKEIDVSLPSYGQMARTLMAVPLEHRTTGEKVTAGSTHWANNSATDLIVNGKKVLPSTAQAGQAKAVIAAMRRRRRVVLGCDSNNTTDVDAGRRELVKAGWKITANSIDIVATLPGVVITSKRLVPVPSDHSRAIVATFTTNTGKA